MKNKNTYFTSIVYSLYMGLIMGFIITSIFLVIVTNVDKYFFNSYLGIRGDLLYYISTIVLIPFFGTIFVFNKRITIEDKVLVLRENSFSFNTSLMDIETIKHISLHEQVGRRRVKKGMKFTDGNKAYMIISKPFSDKVISRFLNDLIIINPNIIIDDYYKNKMK